MAEKDSGYVAPTRKKIKDEVSKLLSSVDPPVDPKLIRKLDWWALYTIHQDVVKDGKDAREIAVTLVRGYDPEKIRAQQEKEAERKARDEERKRRAKEVAARKVESKRKADAARAKAKAAKEKARGARTAAKTKASAAKPASQVEKTAPAKPAPVKAPGAKTAVAKPVARPPRIPASAYVAPVRKHIKDELAKIMPMIKRSNLTGLDYWALYTMHADIVKFGRDPESLARKFVKGYKKKKK